MMKREETGSIEETVQEPHYCVLGNVCLLGSYIRSHRMGSAGISIMLLTAEGSFCLVSLECER